MKTWAKFNGREKKHLEDEHCFVSKKQKQIYLKKKTTQRYDINHTLTFSQHSLKIKPSIWNGLAPYPVSTVSVIHSGGIPRNVDLQKMKDNNSSSAKIMDASADISQHNTASEYGVNNNKVDVDNIKVEEISIENRARQTINGKDDRKASLLGIRMIKCRSVVTISDVLSKDEIEYLAKSSIEAANNQKHKLPTNNKHNNNNNGPGRVCIRMPTLSAANRNDIPDAGGNDLHDPLDGSMSAFVEERILKRTMDYIDRELPDIRQTFFGHDCESLAKLFSDGQLEWSCREPAVNVYYPPDGYFGIHKDNKALTILMPLSSPDGEDFTGGGTAFWSELYPNEHRHKASLVMAPMAGTALLFGGKVSHKGLPIDKGIRVVFVASFARKQRPTANRNKKSWLVSAR